MSHREDINDAHDLQLEELARYFHMPIAEAAKEIGVCATVLKKICRKYVLESSFNTFFVLVKHL